MGRLEIRVCGARNIGNPHRVGKLDPYVKVKVGDKKEKNRIKYKTRVVENSVNPVWNELFKFQVADYDTTTIFFEVWDDNVFVDDLVGSYPLTINSLVRGVVQDRWVLLQGTKISTAELHLRVLAVDFGRDPAPGDKVIASIEQDLLTAPADQKFRPNRRDSPNQTPYPQAPQGLPQQVTYGAQYQPTNYSNQPVYYPGQAPSQPMYSPMPPPPPQPYYQPQGAPMSEPMRPPNFQAMRPPPQQQPQGGLQMAYGVPPDM